MKYSTTNTGSRNKLDFLGVFLFILLILIGWVNIYSVTSDVTQEGIHLSSIASRQLFWISGSVLIILVISFTNVVLIDYLSYYIYGFVILLNIAVLFFGKEVGGAKSWFGFGGVGLQPSEFAKVATAMALSKYLGGYGVRFRGWKHISISIGLFILPIAIILLQNDTGSALVFFSFFLVLYREGLPSYILLTALWLGVLSILTIYFNSLNLSLVILYISIIGLGTIIAYFLRKNRQLLLLIIGISLVSSLYIGIVSFAYQTIFKQYQRDRIEIVMGLKQDKKGMGYNLEQSKIAIGAGRFSGRGFQEGTQTKMGFVPEQHTDFIFCTIGEEWGFVGAMSFFIIYLSLLIRLLFLAERQGNTQGRIFGYSVCCILFFHWFINVGMTIGIIPIIGIPLPFISFGGSSLWGFTLLLFIFLRYDQVRRS